MGLKDFFKPKAPERGRATGGGYWNDVRTMCRDHVDGLITYFRSQNSPRMDWAEAKYREFITPAALDRLMQEAEAVYRDAAWAKSIAAKPVDRAGDWFVTASVGHSAADADFIAACPEKSFEAFAMLSRKMFRLVNPDWENLNTAHWILLLDEKSYSASVHLHTVWSLVNSASWMAKAQDAGGVPKVEFAPVILPQDLMREDFQQFTLRIIREDMAQKRGDPYSL